MNRAIGGAWAPPWAIALASVLVLGCSASNREGVAGWSRAAASSPGAGGAARPPSPRLGDARWVRAKGGDPLDLARLAQAEGASGLSEALDDGDEIQKTALAALPYAPDAEAALGRLGALATTSDKAGLQHVLESIHAIVGEPRRQRELLDPEGVRSCGDVLVALASNAALDPRSRALAVSAARALAEKGYVRREKIPSALDPL